MAVDELPLYVTLENDARPRSSKLALALAFPAAGLAVFGVVLMRDGYSGEAVAALAVAVLLISAALVVKHQLWPRWDGPRADG